MKRILKIAGIALGGITIMLAFVVVFLALGLFNSWIATSLSRIASQNLNGNMVVTEIEGNPLSHFSVKEVFIFQNGQEVLSLDELEVNFRLRGIIGKKVVAELIQLDGVRISLVEEADSIWNLQKLIPSKDVKPIENKAPRKPWNIHLEDIGISNFEAGIDARDSTTKIPHSLNFDASLSFIAHRAVTVLNVSRFELITQEPSLQISHLTFQAGMTDSVITWNDFKLQLPNTNLYSKGSIPLRELDHSELFLHASPLCFDDFEEWLPALHGRPDLRLRIRNEGLYSKIDFELLQENQSVKLGGRISDIGGIPSYSLLLDIDSLNGEYWTHDPEFQSNIKGQLEMNGEGFDFRENTMNARAHFADLKYEKYEMTDFLLFFEKNNKILDGSLKANTLFGDVDAEIHTKDIFETPVYDAVIQLNQLNLAKLSSNKNLESSINLDIQATGRGSEFSEMQGYLRLNSKNSILFDQPIEDFNSKIAIDREKYHIEGFHIETPYMLANISGEGNISDRNLLLFNAEVKNIEKTANALGLNPIHFEGEIGGSISGPAKELVLNTSIRIVDLRTDSLVLRNVHADIASRLSLHRPYSVYSFSSDNKAFMNTLANLYLKTESDVGFAAYGKYYLEDLKFSIEKSEETLEGKLTSNTLFGMLSTQFKISQIFAVPEYQLNTLLRNMDLSEITRNDAYHSDINLEFSLVGTGIEPGVLSADLDLQSEGSSIFGWPIEDFAANIRIQEKNYSLDRFRVETPSAVAIIAGEGNWASDNNLVFELTTTDFGKFPPLFGRDNMQFSAAIQGQLSGTADSLLISSSVNIEDLNFDSIHVKHIIADASLQLTDSAYSGILDLQLNESRIQDFDLSKVRFTSHFNQEKAAGAFVFFANDSLYGNFLSDLHFSDNPTLFIPEMNLNYQNHHWTGGSSSSYIRFREDSIVINDVEFTSRESAIMADGIFAFRGSEDLHLELRNINLVGIAGLRLLPYQISGNLNAMLDITGMAENPVISGNIDIINPELDTLKFTRFYTAFGYADEQIKLNSYLNDNLAQVVSAAMDLPFHFSFADSVVLLNDDSPIDASVSIDHLNLNRFNGFIPLRGAETNGLLKANIRLTNTIKNPFFHGELNLKSGAFSYNKLGVNYSNIELHSQFDNSIFELDSLQILSGKGKLTMMGSVEVDSLFTGELSRLDLNLNGENFQAFDSELLRAVINTNLDLNGSLNHPVFSGNLTVLRSTFNTDLFLKEFNRVSESDQPMLLVALNETENMESQRVAKRDTTRKPPPDVYKSLTGQFNIEIPRNTWVKGDNMNFELAGSIRAIKQGEQIDLFGSMRVKRGYYKIYGRRLDFEEGEVTLTGGQSLNPAINFLIAYRFRDTENVLRKLTVNVTGRVSNPAVKFYLDGIAIEEKDAISYLVFNKNIQQLDSRENTIVKKSNFDVAKDLTIGQISNVVGDALQSSLGLDVIELSGKSGWTQGSVSVGKYISNNLFLNYERTFSLDKKDKIMDPQKISVEYQIYRTLFLQATNQRTNSGFDFILKWTWK